MISKTNFPITYRFKRTIIDGNRVTIPKDTMDSNEWKVGTEIIVTLEPIITPIKGIVI